MSQIAPLPKDQARAVLAEGRRQFPMPEAELERLQQRHWVLNRLPKGSIGAEIGVFRGHFAQAICHIVAPARLYLVDPWRLLGETVGWGAAYTHDGQLPTQLTYDESHAHVSLYPDVESHMIEGYYPACADQIPELLDWAYLDASHSYEATKTELAHMVQQIKPGGFLLGDDWSPNPDDQHHGVYRALLEFTQATRWGIVDAGRGRQWIMRHFP